MVNAGKQRAGASASKYAPDSHSDDASDFGSTSEASDPGEVDDDEQEAPASARKRKGSSKGNTSSTAESSFGSSSRRAANSNHNVSQLSFQTPPLAKKRKSSSQVWGERKKRLMEKLEELPSIHQHDFLFMGLKTLGIQVRREIALLFDTSV